MPTHLNEGEKRFVNDLEAVCKNEAKGLLAGIELYLLRNHNSDKAISFFVESGFRPDFVLWLLTDDHQTIGFIDPKGLRNFTDNFNNSKVQFFSRIKKLEADLKRPGIRLESFFSCLKRSDTTFGGRSQKTPANKRRQTIIVSIIYCSRRRILQEEVRKMLAMMV